MQELVHLLEFFAKLKKFLHSEVNLLIQHHGNPRKSKRECGHYLPWPTSQRVLQSESVNEEIRLDVV